MKTKFLYVCLALLSFTFFAAAQETLQSDSKTAGYKTAFKHSGAGENWFLTIGGGGQTFFGDQSWQSGNPAKTLDHITWQANAALGKWFTPYFALRLKGQGGPLTGYVKQIDGSYYKQNMQYYNVHLDAMWNWANYWGVYSPSKVVSFGPYVGLGYAHRLQTTDAKLDGGVLPKIDPSWVPNAGLAQGFYQRYSDVMSVNGGLFLGFNLSKRISLDFDFGAAIVPDYFNRIVQRAENEAIVGVSGGITFKLGKVGFESVEPMDYALINDLNGKINALRDENSKLSKRPISCPECPKVEAPIVKETNVINYVPNVVFFRISSDRIDPHQKISIYNTAQFMNNTGSKIKVIGYADRGTGTSAYNLDLSRRRAQNVARELMMTYKIPSDRITVEWKGSEVQPYAKNDWNRVVIMSAPQ